MTSGNITLIDVVSWLQALVSYILRSTHRRTGVVVSWLQALVSYIPPRISGSLPTTFAGILNKKMLAYRGQIHHLPPFFHSSSSSSSSSTSYTSSSAGKCAGIAPLAASWGIIAPQGVQSTEKRVFAQCGRIVQEIQAFYINTNRSKTQ